MEQRNLDEALETLVLALLAVYGRNDPLAVTFWGKRDLRTLLKQALTMLDEHYAKHQPQRHSGRKRG